MWRSWIAGKSCRLSKRASAADLCYGILRMLPCWCLCSLCSDRGREVCAGGCVAPNARSARQAASFQWQDMQQQVRLQVPCNWCVGILVTRDWCSDDSDWSVSAPKALALLVKRCARLLQRVLSSSTLFVSERRLCTAVRCGPAQVDLSRAAAAAC